MNYSFVISKSQKRNQSLVVLLYKQCWHGEIDKIVIEILK